MLYMLIYDLGTMNTSNSNIKQTLQFASNEQGKLFALRQLVTEGKLLTPCMIFVQNIDRVKELHRELLYDGLNTGMIHAELTATQRNTVINAFRTGEIWVLITTDLLARGMDFKAINMVINYDLPSSPIAYIHRIGRTGRGGRPGTAVTFFTEQDITQLRSIANIMKFSGCEVPDWMLTIKQVCVIVCFILPSV